jgi:hypothetical protein
MYVFTQSHGEKYWNLVKVFVSNIYFCHFIAILLIAITHCGEDTTWMVEKGIDMEHWTKQYIWSYYFGTTIMLTIGFGDFHATNPM